MATDWQPVSLPIGRTGGIASRSWYQNFWLFDPPPTALPPPSSQCKIFRRSRDKSPASQPRVERFAIVVTSGISFVVITIVRVASDDSCFRIAPTLVSFHTFPRDAGLRTTTILRLEAACGPISRLPEIQLFILYGRSSIDNSSIESQSVNMTMTVVSCSTLATLRSHLDKHRGDTNFVRTIASFLLRARRNESDWKRTRNERVWDERSATACEGRSIRSPKDRTRQSQCLCSGVARAMYCKGDVFAERLFSAFFSPKAGVRTRARNGVRQTKHYWRTEHLTSLRQSETKLSVPLMLSFHLSLAEQEWIGNGGNSDKLSANKCYNLKNSLTDSHCSSVAVPIKRVYFFKALPLYTSAFFATFSKHGGVRSFKWNSDKCRIIEPKNYLTAIPKKFWFRYTFFLVAIVNKYEWHLRTTGRFLDKANK